MKTRKTFSFASCPAWQLRLIAFLVFLVGAIILSRSSEFGGSLFTFLAVYSAITAPDYRDLIGACPSIVSSFKKFVRQIVVGQLPAKK
jgi:hypothetical protein